MQVTERQTDFTVFDLETTGLNRGVDEIIEIGAIRFRNNVPVLKYETFVKPSIHVPKAASLVNNITDDMVADGLTPFEATRRFKEFIGDDVLIGHNIEAFDLPFINQYVNSYLGCTIDNDYTDTVLLARHKLPHLGSRSLQSLSSYYNVSYANAHRAIRDCLINAEIYRCLYEYDVPECELGIKLCEKCNKPMKLKIGRYGRYWGCSSYPQCNGSSKYVNYHRP